MPKTKSTPDVVVDKETLDAAVEFINETANETIYKGSVKIGEYILKHIFNDDIKVATSRNPQKKESFRRLCERDDLNIHPNRLGLMVRVASQERFLVNKKVDIGLLTYTHKASLVKLDNNSKKISLIKKCIEKKMTTRGLDSEINKELKRLSSNRGPSLIQTTRKYINQVETVLETVQNNSLQINESKLSDMSLDRLTNLETHLKDLKKKAEDAEKRTKGLTLGCNDLLAKLTAVKNDKKKNPPKRGRKPKKAKK